MNLRSSMILPPALLVSLVGGCGSSSGSWDDYNACMQTETQARTAGFAAAAPQGPFSARLVEREPAALTAAVRADLKASMRASVESSRAARIASLRCEHLRPPPSDDGESMNAGAAAPSAAADRSSADDGAKQASGTNNQVAGVDEADFVKNDNKYIYVANGSRFRVVEAWPAESAHEIASVPVPGEAKKLFVEGDRALVYSSTERSSAGQPYGGYGGYGGAYYPGGSGECTYGYDGCVPAGDGTETEISIFDITDRSAPKLVRSIHSSSSLIAARRIGSAVHTVLGQPSAIAGFGLETSPSGLGAEPTEDELNAAYDALIAKNAAAIDAIDVGDMLPRWTDSAGRAPETTLFQSSIPDGSAFTSVLSVDLAADPALKVASVLSRPGWVYASANALYMAVPQQQIAGWGWYEGRAEKELSTIHKFEIGASTLGTAYVGSGIVKGRVLNQFAMDDKDGFLRVATTTSRAPSPDAHSTISVMEDKGGQLEVAAAIDDIAKSEDIRSVRFDGDRGYVVTFKKTDPLFVFDLSDPRAPKTMGELKIPGFSTYMHMMDPTHLLTIGYDASDKGDFAYFTGVILQIFDVSDPKDPKLSHKETIGTRGTSSEALTNHLAFNYFAPKDLLALPMTICEGGDGNGNYGSEMTFNGLMVYDATVASGFSLKGKVAHPNGSRTDARNGYGYSDAGCSNWWSNASSEVKRSIIMDDWVFSVSNTRIKVNNLGALSTDVAEIELE